MPTFSGEEIGTEVAIRVGGGSLLHYKEAGVRYTTNGIGFIL